MSLIMRKTTDFSQKVPDLEECVDIGKEITCRAEEFC